MYVRHKKTRCRYGFHFRNDPTPAKKTAFENVGVQFQEANYQDKVTVSELCEVTQSLYKNAADYGVLLKQFGIFDKAKVW